MCCTQDQNRNGNIPYTGHTDLDLEQCSKCQSLLTQGRYSDAQTLIQSVLNAHMRSVGVGIGFLVSASPSSCKIVEVRRHGSAWMDGRIKAGDELVSVDAWPTSGQPVSDITAKILGLAGTKTTLGIAKAQSSGDQRTVTTVTLVRRSSEAADEALKLTHCCMDHFSLLQKALQDKDEKYLELLHKHDSLQGALQDQDQKYCELLREYESLKGKLGQAAPAKESSQDGVGLVGVGLALDWNKANAAFQISDIIPGMAADASNLASADRKFPNSRSKYQSYNIIDVGDTLVAVDGITVAGQRLPGINKLFLGPSGSKCILHLQKTNVVQDPSAMSSHVYT